jgi:hypothetical protein
VFDYRSKGELMNRELAAQKTRSCLESRIASILECQPSDLPHLKLGSLLDFAFLLKGHSEELGGFHTSMHALLDLLGHEIVSEVEPKEGAQESPSKELIN